MLVDVHCHLTHESFKNNLNEVIERAKKAGVTTIITSGVNVPTNREVLNLTKKYKEVKCTLGLYPIDLLGESDETGLARQIDPFDLEKEMKFIEQHKDEILGVGECGMDFYWDKERHEIQKKNFEKILGFVKKINKPIIIHSREAEAECIDLLEKSGIKKVVLHMFEGNKKLIKRAESLGYYFSIPAILHKNQHFRMLVELVNVNQLMTETDAPWRGPQPGLTNEPSNVAQTIKEIAKIKKMDEKEVENIVYMNFQKLFL